MKRTLTISFAALLIGMATAARAESQIDWAHAATMTVKLSSYAFSPDVVTLRQGQPVRLILENDAGGSHDFTAPEFFSSVAYGSGNASPPDGSIYVDGGDKIEIHLTPRKPGSYPLECSHFMHSFFGMNGKIVVTGG